MGILKGHSGKKERISELFFLFLLYNYLYNQTLKSVEALQDSYQVHMSSSLKLRE